MFCLSIIMWLCQQGAWLMAVDGLLIEALQTSPMHFSLRFAPSLCRVTSSWKVIGNLKKLGNFAHLWKVREFCCTTSQSIIVVEKFNFFSLHPHSSTKSWTSTLKFLNLRLCTKKCTNDYSVCLFTVISWYSINSCSYCNWYFLILSRS